MKSEITTENGDPGNRIKLAAVILAAGKGTRMKSRLPKILHPLGGLPMVEHACRAADQAGASPVVVVVGPATADVSEALSAEVTFAYQVAADGTAGAAEAGIAGVPDDTSLVLVINGDVPLVEPSTLRVLAEEVSDKDSLVGIATFDTPANTRYGRIVRGDNGRTSGIVEFADDDERAQLETFEANSGIYCFDADWLRQHVGLVEAGPSGERYLTDLVKVACDLEPAGNPVITVRGDAESLVGIDDRVRLAEAEATLRNRKLVALMKAGVSIVDPATTYIDADVQIGQDARIEPGCHIHGQTTIGEGAIVGPGSVIQDSEIGAEAVVRQSWIEGSIIGDHVSIGPYSHLRPGTVVETGSRIGNYVEMKNTHFGEGSQAGHFSYLGDATIGRGTNIGAGTVTCNYDGETKHRTIIGDGVFVGSDSMLVAPVELGDGSATGAGSVVTRSVPPGMRAVGVPARVMGPVDREAVDEEEGQH